MKQEGHAPTEILLEPKKVQYKDFIALYMEYHACRLLMLWMENKRGVPTHQVLLGSFLTMVISILHL
jgi:hypothetical protein